MTKVPTFRNALVSVSDKTGLVELLSPLQKQGMRIVSTGGTAAYLRQHGLTVVEVSEQTGAPEVMGGRVKTLHPRIHMALLSRDGHSEDLHLLKQEGLEPFDLVVVNLYPFEEKMSQCSSEEELIEFIDIGGPSLLRAASKNFSRISVVCDPKDYSLVGEKGAGDLAWRRYLAAKVLAHVSSYDALIAETLGHHAGGSDWSLGGRLEKNLRYGENPHQSATWYRRRGSGGGLHEAQVLQGKELSYNNLLDLDAAVTLVSRLPSPSAVAVKHNNPCGVAMDSQPLQALTKALQADPVSVFGGIVAVNFKIEEEASQILSGIFLEGIVAPDYSKEAVAQFKNKKNLRILCWPGMGAVRDLWKVRTVLGGVLVQQADQFDEWDSHWQILGSSPDDLIRADLVLAWKTVSALKSNAIAVVAGGQTLGLGMGQVNRVDAVAQSLSRWKQFHPRVKENVVLASDAFFPFADSIELLAKAGVQWVIQPGGSLRDQEVFDCARAQGIHMILTGRRHFSH